MFSLIPFQPVTAIATGFFATGIDTISKVVVAIGIGLGILGGINYFDGYSNDNPGAKAQGIKQFVSGAGIVILATTLFPILKSQF